MDTSRLSRLWGLGSGGLLLVAVLWGVWTGILDKPRQVVLTIPPGTAARLQAGQVVTAIPQTIHLRVDDVVVLQNQDQVPHRVGGLYVRPGETLSQPFRRAGTFEYICTLHPENHTIFQVAPRPSLFTLLGIEVGLAGVLLQLSGLLLGGWATRWGGGALLAGTVGILLGVGLVLQASGLMNPGAEDWQNPVPPDAISLQQGQRLYAQFCVPCHGGSGRGDGPLAAHLSPPPADLVVHVPQHPDHILFQLIQEGIPGTQMPALRERLTAEEIWHLVNYLRSLTHTADSKPL